MTTRKICVVTGSRADYGLLYWLLRALRGEPQFDLQVVATGMHLAPEFGLTKNDITADGFDLAAEVDTLLASDTPAGVAKSIGLGIIGFADAFQRLAPELVVVLGDRFEILAAATAAYIARIPLAHIGGGDTTEGAFDEAIRHSITKMSQLHFVATEDARRRVLQLGEDPRHVYVVGHTGVEAIERMELYPRHEIEQRLGVRLRKRNFLITFHPVTLASTPSQTQFAELLAALEAFGDDTGLLFTKPNADTEGRALIAMLDDFARTHDNAAVFTNLGQRMYLSVAAQADAVIGNSSSGLFEAPSLKRPTVNIGSRQQGRPLAKSIVSCEPLAASIRGAIEQALKLDCSKVTNPFGRGETSRAIVETLKGIESPRDLLQKRFHDWKQLP